VHVVNLSAKVSQVGVCKCASCRWYCAGTLPVPARRAGRLILVGLREPVGEPGRTVICARAWSADGRADLDRQVARLSGWVMSNGMTVAEVVTEVGSAINGRRGARGRSLRALRCVQSAAAGGTGG
jgi:predicted site-specific integrase-resolvase